MKSVWRTLAALVVMLAMTASSYAQVMDQVPKSALVVLHVKNMAELSQKIADWGKLTGTTEQAPPMADLLDFAAIQMNMTQGIKKDGDMAVALINDVKGFGGPKGPVMVFVPVSDYAAFTGNFTGAATDANVTTVNNAFGGGQPVYISKWGDYAVITPIKDLLNLAPGGVVMTPAASKEIDSKDISVLVNMPTVRGLVIPLMIGGRQAVSQQILNGIRQSPYAKYSAVARVAFNQFADFAQHFLSDCDDVTYGINLAQDGLSSTAIVDFKPDSVWGQRVASAPNSDKSLLNGLPDGKYFLMAGSITDSKNALQIISEVVDPIVAELTKVGPDAQPIVDYIQGIKDAVAATTSRNFALVAPDGELGASPLFQFVGVTHGDAKTLATLTTKVIQLQQDWMTKMGAGSPVQNTFTPAAKTLDGVQFDQIHTGVNLNAPPNPQLAQMSQVFLFMYGQDGMNIFLGPVTDTALLGVGGLADDKISAAIAAVKSDNDSVGAQPGIQNTASHLPKQRQLVAYFPVDILVNTAFGYAAKFGLDMGVTMPACDPIGVTLGTEGSTARIEGYVPSQLVTGAVNVIKKVRGAAHPGGPGGPGAPPAGGGL